MVSKAQPFNLLRTIKIYMLLRFDLFPQIIKNVGQARRRGTSERNSYRSAFIYCEILKGITTVLDTCYRRREI